MSSTEIATRKARRADLPTLGRLGAALLRAHHAFDDKRFMAPGTAPEDGYAWFLGTQLARRDVAILVAERDTIVVGYVYAGIEPKSWRELRDEAGFVHDVVVDESARGEGVGTALLLAAFEWLRGRGVPRVVLWTAQANTPAHRLFAKLGFRSTMVEMTKELGGHDGGQATVDD
jgi:GNAT superfamily N-acetyltransferase